MYETLVILTDNGMLDITLGVQFSLVSVVRDEGWRISFVDEVFDSKFHKNCKLEQEEKYTMNFEGKPGKFWDNYQVHGRVLQDRQLRRKETSCRKIVICVR